jgi:hypothetical protein
LLRQDHGPLAVNTNSALDYWLKTVGPVGGPRGTLAGALTVAVVAWVIATYLLPHELVLPLVVILLFVLAGLVAMVALNRPGRRERGRLGYLDVAGVLAFVGICIAAGIGARPAGASLP